MNPTHKKIYRVINEEVFQVSHYHVVPPTTHNQGQEWRCLFRNWLNICIQIILNPEDIYIYIHVYKSFTYVYKYILHLTFETMSPCSFFSFKILQLRGPVQKSCGYEWAYGGPPRSPQQPITSGQTTLFIFYFLVLDTIKMATKMTIWRGVFPL